MSNSAGYGVLWSRIVLSLRAKFSHIPAFYSSITLNIGSRQNFSSYKPHKTQEYFQFIVCHTFIPVSSKASWLPLVIWVLEEPFCQQTHINCKWGCKSFRLKGRKWNTPFQNQKLSSNNWILFISENM
jgi:hypothetical protein